MMTTFKLSNPLFGSARLITVNFPATVDEIEQLANKNPTSGVWMVTSHIGDWCSDINNLKDSTGIPNDEDYNRTHEITREHADDGRTRF